MARIDAIPIEGTPSDMRAGFDVLTEAQTRLPRSSLGGVPSVRVGAGPRQIIWLHGGGYVFGSPESHAVSAQALADAAGATVILPDYPLAPEAPWPAQLHAAQAVLDALDAPVAVTGDSAGGHLALNLALSRPGRISGLVLMSPNTDRTGQSRTRSRTTDAMNDDASDSRLADIAFAGRDRTDPEVSPILADLSGLPPLRIQAAGNEILLDDALRLADAIALQGGAVDLRVWPGLFHLWPDALDHAQEALADAARHIRQVLPDTP